MTQTCGATADVERAAERIAPWIHRTPVITSRSIDALAGANLYFKAEHLQRVGAFKFRGACHALSQLDADTRRRGVVTHSSGNHAQAVALAARLMDIEARIVMPTSAPRVKREAVIGYGAEIIDCQPTLESRESTAAEVQRQTGAELVHPYNDPAIIAGQGTAALELLDEVPDLRYLVAPIGGGGLISGTCLAALGRPQPPTVIGCEPAGADDAWQSKQAGEWIPQTDPRTIADGLRTSLGSLTWPFVRDQVAEVIRIEDEETVAAMRLFWQRTKQLIEPSAAVAVAAAMQLAQRLGDSNMRIGVILSGGNVDLDQLPWQ